MGLVIFIVIVGAIWIIVQLNNSKIEEFSEKSHIKIISDKVQHDESYIVNTGSVLQLSENSFSINPKSPLPLTLQNVTEARARRIKNLLDGEAKFKNNLLNITFLLLKYNIKCPELEDFISKARTKVFSYVDELKKKSSEWEESSEKDKADLIEEFQSEAFEQLATKPIKEHEFSTLIFKSEKSIVVNEKLLKMFLKKPKLYHFYVSNIGRFEKVIQIPPDNYYRKNWASLVELGLARRGKDIPIEMLIKRLKMKEINEYFADRLQKKFTKKTKAVEFAIIQPDAIDVLGEHISFRQIFQILKPKDIEVSEIELSYQYASAEAEIIRDTYVTGYRTLEILEYAKGEGYTGWEIDAQDCCSTCSKLDGKKTKRKPIKLPPFHVGCMCSLDGIYD